MFDPDRLTAVVVNWRTPELTIRAARALIDDGVPADRVVVVDNGSGDASAERIGEALPHSPLIALSENVGFARANNLGARRHPASAAYLFVNSDAFVHRPGSTAALLRALDDGEIGIVVPRLLNPDLTLQRNVVPFSTPLPELVRASGLSRWVPNRLQPTLGTYWDHARPRLIESAIGAVVLIRATTWQELGGFDERRHMYVEDHDLFWRASQSGWRRLFLPTAEFLHVGGASATQRWSDPQRALTIASAERAMIREHLGPLRASATLAIMAAGVAIRAVAHALRGRVAAARSQLGWLRGYVGWAPGGLRRKAP